MSKSQKHPPKKKSGSRFVLISYSLSVSRQEQRMEVLRPSLFHRVPPFINFVPSFEAPSDDGDCDEKPVYGLQYWDQRQWDQVRTTLTNYVDVV